MIPFDSSVTPLQDKDLNPNLPWQEMENEYQSAQPPANRIPAATDVEGEERQDTGDCTRRDQPSPGFDAYIPSVQSGTPSGTYSPEGIRRRFASLNTPGMLMPEPPDPANAEAMTTAEKEELRQLKERDREVRRHEMTHKALLGADAGAVSYTYQVGPDGRAYAVGGSVEVNVGKGRTPQETLMKANRLRSAALSVGEPSAADMSVGMQAAEMQAESLRQING